MTSPTREDTLTDPTSQVSSRRNRRFHPAFRLIDNRQRISFVLLSLGRVAVGLCDLSVASAMYLLFMLLQGQVSVSHLRWAPKTTLSAALIASALVALRALLDVASEYCVLRRIQRLYTEFVLRLARGYSEMRWSRFVECNRSELSNYTLHTAREAADFYHFCIEMTADVVTVAVMTAAIVHRSPSVACGFGVAVAGFYSVHRFLIRRKLQSAASGREQSLRTLQKYLADIFTSGKEIRIYSNYAFFHDRARRQAEHLGSSNLQVQSLPQIARIVAEQGAVLLFLCILIVVQLRQGDARQLLSLLAFYFVLSRRLLPLISQIVFIAGRMENSYESVKIVGFQLDECSRNRAQDSPVLPPAAGFAMELDRVSFSFNENAPVLRNVTLCLRKKEIVVLHGTSGIGKSSLLNLIAGVLQPITGAVRVDRATIAYVPQEVPLLDDSVRNNLLFGLAMKSDQELMKALAIARLDQFVAQQPLGLDTAVGDNGALFSGGERQRLGLARAILREGELLLLDEATSALDKENERQVLENLKASGRSVLLVTHRTQIGLFADRVFRLEAGRLFEEGVPESPAGQLVLSTIRTD